MDPDHYIEDWTESRVYKRAMKAEAIIREEEYHQYQCDSSAGEFNDSLRSSGLSEDSITDESSPHKKSPRRQIDNA